MMSSGTPVCPICQKEHNDAKDFDTDTVCNKCNPLPGLVIPPHIIKKMYARFNVDPLAFYSRKEILQGFMIKYVYSVKRGTSDQPN